MGVYSYPQSNIIDEVAFVKSEGGHTRAYLHAADSANPETLKDINCKLAEKGWQVTPYNRDGKPVLEVLGFGSEKKLQSLLQTAGWAQGDAAFTRDVKDKLSFSEQVKKRSLGVSGLFYLLGDASFAKYGYDGSNKLNMAAGGMYGAGTLSLLGFGRKDQTDLQVKDIATKLEAYMREKGDQMPENCSLESITRDHEKGLIRKADDLFRRYPSEMMNIFFAAAGALIAVSSYKSLHYKPTTAKEIAEHEKTLEEVFQAKKKHNPEITKAFVAEKKHKSHIRESYLDIGLGAMTGASGLFAAAIKEKAPDPDAPEKHGMAKVWEKIQEKPLTIAGAGYMVSTLCHAASTAMAWNWADQKTKSTVKWRASFVANNIIAEILLAMSSKGHGHGVKSDGAVDKTIISLASDMIVKQPQAQQEELIEHVARFLGRRDVLATKDEEVRAALHRSVEAMRNNPWAVDAPSAGQSTLPENWQAKLNQKAADEQQPQLSQ